LQTQDLNEFEETIMRTPNIWLRRLTPVVLVLAIIGIGVIPRLASRGALQAQTRSFELPTVAIVYPQAAPQVQKITLPADVQAYQEASIFARTNGYLAHWYADIGTHVATGQLLATIDTPEIDAQLEQARADAAMAAARYGIAKVTADRWVELLKSNAVPREQTQQNVANMQSGLAALKSAKANVDRLTKLQAYESVLAPFPGVVTARNIDVGALIDAGSAGGPKSQLFHLVETDKLRVFVDVPQEYAADVTPGTHATLVLPQWPDRTFAGGVTRTAGAIDPVSRTLRVEVDVDNPNEVILPGAYGSLTLEVARGRGRPSLPVNTLLFRPDGVQVAVVDANGKVQMTTITLGRDFGTRVEVTAGLSGAERVIVNPSDSITAGEPVRIVPSGAQPAASMAQNKS
jgi:membrane fusion protein, multidrug efflux system